ncbi:MULTISPECIES: hypothetical protein [Nitrospirillum]|uniref:Uncharacterized protein n=1 Tax=Nitrospirillum amazonense TaxID=28077 RepID=A0A560GAW4_9PROT|nr:hypothetical protein [Nitrospirillum amazonense]MEC4590783.1 hypothetical protein [Nitrospirillum amazonense]TWB30959.1 hypothetical protein FBZ88_102526 [Nitrospirillum amazonense]
MSNRNEGEGNRTATRAYDKHARDFVATGQVAEKARAAADAVDGPEGRDLEQAEARGKAHAREEDRLLRPSASKHDSER